MKRFIIWRLIGEQAFRGSDICIHHINGKSKKVNDQSKKVKI